MSTAPTNGENMKTYQQATTGVLHLQRNCSITARTRYWHFERELTDELRDGAPHCHKCWDGMKPVKKEKEPVWPAVSFIGGTMYGDGEYVVEFHYTRSTLGPITATLLAAGSVRSVEFEDGTEPNVQTARQVIARARIQDAKAGA
jgi:hypothetical protein